MSDGPFKNLRLVAHHRKVVETLGNDAFSDEERSDRICHAVLKDFSDSGDLGLVTAIQAEMQKDQLDLDVIGTVNRIFEQNNKTSSTDALQQETLYCLHHGETLENALEHALPRAVERQTQEFNNRIQEAFLQAQENGDAKNHEVSDAMRDLQRASQTVPIDKICDALRAGDKNAFKENIKKKEGAEEGTSL